MINHLPVLAKRHLAWLAAAALLGLAAPAQAKDYLLTGVKPDRLVLVDAAAREVVRTYVVPDARPGILTITPSPDGKRAYAVVNRWESVAGIDLDTGEQVFRADLSSGDLRVKAMFGMDVSPDGKELYVFESPVRLLPDRYEVQETRISVYDTSHGVGAKPVRSFPASRRTAILAASKSGDRLYGLSWDLTVYDPRTGAVLDTLGVRHWNRPNYSEPDVLDVWPQWEVAGVFSTPYYAVRTDKSPDDPAAYKTGLLTLDLDSGEFAVRDFEDTAAIIFSTVVNPVRRDEVYGVYTTLSKIDADAGRLVERIDLDHTYYDINVSSDGEEIYVGGTMSDIAIYSTATLERIGTIEMPDGNDMALASLRVIQR